MTTNPFYNALFAIAYIVGIVSFITFGAPVLMGDAKSVFIPMAMLSLLVLSVSVMAYLFFYKPVMLLLDGQREKAVKLFLQTVGIFAGITVVTFLIATFFS